MFNIRGSSKNVRKKRESNHKSKRGYKKNRCYPLPADKVRVLRHGEDVWATIIDPMMNQLVRVKFTGNEDWIHLEQGSLVYIQHTNYQGPAVIAKDGIVMLPGGKSIRALGSFINSVIGEAVETHHRN